VTSGEAVDWIHQGEWDKWRALVNTTLNLRVSRNARNFFTSWVKKTLLYRLKKRLLYRLSYSQLIDEKFCSCNLIKGGCSKIHTTLNYFSLFL
jgi:hypothetical protein